jgi:predicted RNA-binding protein YlqC (UPF0109 family)
MKVEDLIKQLVSGLVADQEAVSVTSKELSRSINIFVQVGEFDQGKVLGQRRSTLDALINISEKAGNMIGKVVRIELMEPIKTGKTPPPHQFVAAAKWKTDDFKEILISTLKAVFGTFELSVTKIKPTVTVCEVTVKKPSPLHGQTAFLQRDFETLFHAIGKSFKHVVHLDLIPEE